MSSIRPYFHRIGLGGLIVALSAQATLADGYGLFHPFHHTYVSQSSTVTTGTHSATTTGLVPMSVIAPTSIVHTSALVPMSLTPASLVPASLVPASLVPASLVPASLVPASLVPASVTTMVPMSHGHFGHKTFTTHHLLAPSSVMYYTAAQTAAPAAGKAATPILGGAGKSTGPLVPASVTPGGSTSDFRSEYNTFALSENALAPAGMPLHQNDVASMSTTHSALAKAVGGVHQLASIARFLATKVLTDPNFQAKALDLLNAFAPFPISASEPAVKLFLDQIRQGVAENGKPANSTPSFNIANVSGSFSGQLNANGGFTGQFSPDKVPDPSKVPDAPKPVDVPDMPMPVESPLKTIKAVASALGATIVSDDANGLILKTLDGRTVKYGPTGIPIP